MLLPACATSVHLTGTGRKRMRLHCVSGLPKSSAAEHAQGPSKTAILKVAMSRVHHHYKTLAWPHYTLLQPNQILFLYFPSVNLRVSIGVVAVQIYTRSACHKQEAQQPPSWG
uniref:(northern house mosquito) hypothetical protein n=1 Tax=Culex pipiens TaxID=7175 RepID=A0A8D8FQZ4_CULPI